MFYKCRTLRYQKPLYIGTQTEVEDEKDLGTLRRTYQYDLRSIHASLQPIGKTYTQQPNSEKNGEVPWMPWAPLVAQADLRSKVNYGILYCLKNNVSSVSLCNDQSIIVFVVKIAWVHSDIVSGFSTNIQNLFSLCRAVALSGKG